MSDEKIFQYLVSRVQTRETSTHAVASIASSSSLVLLGLFFLSAISDTDKNIIMWIGIISPILGFLYFEITFATQQSWDYDIITKIIKKDSKREKNELDDIIYGKNDDLVIPKMLLWRILLLLPFIGWLSIGRELEYIVIIIFLTSIVLSLLIIRIQYKKQKERTKNNSSQDNTLPNSEP